VPDGGGWSTPRPGRCTPGKGSVPLFNKWKGNNFKKVNVKVGALFSVIYIMNKANTVLKTDI
jgi:hypothetical protein